MKDTKIKVLFNIINFINIKLTCRVIHAATESKYKLNDIGEC